MSEYHPYVFDEASRTFVGKFEEMYRAEMEAGFDSWHQEDLNNLTRRICLVLVEQYTFRRILDLGCGKGVFTQLLHKRNNEVVGIDISEAALERARARAPAIQFQKADLTDPNFALPTVGTAFDLVVMLELLSYLENWRSILRQAARVARRALVSLYLPEDPIGFVKSFDELRDEFSLHFEVEEKILLPQRRQLILMGQGKSEA